MRDGSNAARCGRAFRAARARPDRTTPLSIQFNPPQLPSMLVGEELHDTLGNIDSLHAIVFNSAGDTIHGGTGSLLARGYDAHRDDRLDHRPRDGRVTRDPREWWRRARRCSRRRKRCSWCRRPTVFTNVTALDDTLTFTPVRSDTLFPLSVSLASGSDPVNHYRIEYRFVYPAALNIADSTQILLTDENRKFSLVDTTGTGTTAVGGSATRYLRITPFTHFTSDTVIVEARAFLPDHTPVSGSPLRFKVLVQIQ